MQIRIIPVGEDHREPAAGSKERLGDVPGRGRRARRHRRQADPDAEVEKIPYVIVYGDKESDESLAVRKRGGSSPPSAWTSFVRKSPRLLHL